jgi:flagellar protein FlbD
MIQLTRLNGVPFAVNADLIERVESAPDTVVAMIDGRKYVVAESAADVIERVVRYRAAILIAADSLHGADQPAAGGNGSGTARVLRLVDGGGHSGGPTDSHDRMPHGEV